MNISDSTPVCPIGTAQSDVPDPIHIFRGNGIRSWKAVEHIYERHPDAGQDVQWQTELSEVHVALGKHLLTASPC